MLYTATKVRRIQTCPKEHPSPAVTSSDAIENLDDATVVEEDLDDTTVVEEDLDNTTVAAGIPQSDSMP